MARLAVLDAQAQGFATSFVVVSDNDLQFHRFDDVYRKVLTELGTASCPRGALGDVLDRWIGRVEEALIAAGEDDADPAFDATVAKRLDEDLAALTGGRAPQDFVRVIQTIFELKQQGNVAEAGALISWLCGSGNVAASVKRTAGIKGDIDEPRRPRLPAGRAGDREGRRVQGAGHRHRRGRDDPADALGLAAQVPQRHPADRRRLGLLSRACSGSSPARRSSSTPGTGSPASPRSTSGSGS